MPGPRQPCGAVLEQQVKPEVRLPRDKGDADEPRVAGDEARGRMRRVINHSGEVGDGHADKRRDDEPGRSVVYSRAGAREHRLRIPAEFGER